MAWLKNFGQSIGKVFTTGPVKVVADRTAEIITEDIPHVVTKEIPDFIVKDVPEFVGDVVEGPDRDKKDPSLPRRRKAVADLRAAFETRRDDYLDERARLAEARRRYEALMETFAGSDRLRVKRPALYVAEREWEMPGGAAQSVPEAIENGARYVLGFVTFNVTEHAWHGKDNREEHAYLNRQEAALKPVLKQLNAAIALMQAEGRQLEDDIAEMLATLKAAGVDADQDAVSELKLWETQQEARLSLARKLLGDGAAIDDIAFITGLGVAEIEALKPCNAEPVDDATAQALFDAADALAEAP